MNLYIQLFLFIVVIVPFSLFWHELGHLIGARIVRASHVTLTIGIGKTIWQRTFNNMTFIVRQIFIFHSLTETNRAHSLSKKEIILITVMGPISSLVLSILAYCFDTLIMSNTVIHLMFLFNGWISIINLLPFKFNERQSDGYTILQMIKK